jgi:hypothetical protein
MKIRTPLAAALCVLLAPGTAAGQGQFPLVEQSKSLIVEIWADIPSTTPDSQRSHGSGIVVGYRADTLFIVTAKHVLCGPRPCESPLDDSVSVHLRGAPARPLVASVVMMDPELDLAVLAAGNVKSTGLQPEMLPLHRLGRSGRIGPSTVLVPVGCSTTVDCWVSPLEAGRWERNVGPALLFRLLGLENGYSGGGVFTADGELVGMTIVDGDRVANIRALTIDSVRARVLRHADGTVPFMLRAPRVPLRGYHVSATTGVVAGWTTYPDRWRGVGYVPVVGAQVEASGRVRGRLSMAARARYLASRWSRSGTLAVGPQVSANLSRRPDRLPALSYRASLQASGSHLLGQRFVGGYYDGYGSGYDYRLYQQVSTTVFGAAASGSVDVILAPHVGAGLGYAVDYYPSIRSDFPAVISVFSLSARVSL